MGLWDWTKAALCVLLSPGKTSRGGQREEKQKEKNSHVQLPRLAGEVLSYCPGGQFGSVSSPMHPYAVCMYVGSRSTGGGINHHQGSLPHHGPPGSTRRVNRGIRNSVGDAPGRQMGDLFFFSEVGAANSLIP